MKLILAMSMILYSLSSSAMEKERKEKALTLIMLVCPICAVGAIVQDMPENPPKTDQKPTEPSRSIANEK